MFRGLQRSSFSLCAEGEARCSPRWQGALRTCCRWDRLWCSRSRSGGHTGRPRFLWSLHLLPSRSSPIETTRGGFIRPREAAISWKSVTTCLCHTTAQVRRALHRSENFLRDLSRMTFRLNRPRLTAHKGASTSMNSSSKSRTKKRLNGRGGLKKSGSNLPARYRHHCLEAATSRGFLKQAVENVYLSFENFALK